MNSKVKNPTLSQLADKLETLEDRIDAIIQDDDGDKSFANENKQCCSAPPPPERDFEQDVSEHRREAILSNQWKWLNGTNIKYYFIGGPEKQRQVVRDSWKVWKDVGIGLDFTETQLWGESDIRISFKLGGSWSVLGKNCRNFPNEATMNFGWDLTQSGPNGLDTAIHEIGHALGFQHEHQNPNAGIEWNREACYRYFRQTQSPPWDRAKTDHNVLNTLHPNSVQGSDWDANSIMHYSFAAGLIVSPANYRNGLEPDAGLSPKDKKVVRQLYPPLTSNVIPQLNVDKFIVLDIAPSEQIDFNVIPEETRWYRFQTTGMSDTLMVLFEEDEEGMDFVIGDDDSGFGRNAQFDVRLRRGRKYQLRMRLYYENLSGKTNVLMY